MRVKSATFAIVCAIVGLGAIAPALSASNLNSSKSNVYRVATPKDEEACKAAGGKVETKDGEKVCSVPFVGGAMAD